MNQDRVDSSFILHPSSFRERPYRCPGYPLVPALYVILPAFVLVNMFMHETIEALAGVAFIALGATVYGLMRLVRKNG